MTERLGATSGGTLLGVAFSAAAVWACSSADSDRPGEPATPVRLDGEYSANGGPVAALLFTGDRHDLRPSTCAANDSSCVETGTYSLNREHDSLTLTHGAESTRYPFRIRELEPSSSVLPRALTEGSVALVSSGRVQRFELVASTGPISLTHTEWTVDQCLGACREFPGPGCMPATTSACHGLRFGYCCD